MTSKVEEVEWRKNELLALCCTTDVALNEIRKEHLSLLISAAHAEGVAEGMSKLEKQNSDAFNKLIDDHDTAFAKGVAEGAEQERKRINTECIGPVYDGSKVITTMPDRPFYLVPVDAVRLSVLAPTKEKP